MSRLHSSQNTIAATRYGLNSDHEPMEIPNKEVASFRDLKLIFSVNDGDIAVSDETIDRLLCGCIKRAAVLELNKRRYVKNCLC